MRMRGAKNPITQGRSSSFVKQICARLRHHLQLKPDCREVALAQDSIGIAVFHKLRNRNECIAKSAARKTDATSQIAAIARLQRVSNCNHGCVEVPNVPMETALDAATGRCDSRGTKGRATSVANPAAQTAKRCAAGMRGARRRQMARPEATRTPCQNAVAMMEAATGESARTQRGARRSQRASSTGLRQ